MADLRPLHKRHDGTSGAHPLAQSYEQRKINALEGRAVDGRGDAYLQSYNASDKWNRHQFSAHANERPIHVGAYAPFGARTMQSSHHVISGHPTPRADMEFGLMRIPVEHMVLERAPDASRQAIPRTGDIGRMAF